MSAPTSSAAAQVEDLRAALASGGLPDDAAELIDLIRSLEDLKSTACLTKEQRAFVDEELCADPATLAGLGTGEIVQRAKTLAAELDPAAIARLATCFAPYCDAPIRHSDHITPAHDGGATSADNGQGLCEACNHAKNAPGWKQRPVAEPGLRHGVETITPTGHRYRSHAPPPPGFREPRYVHTGPGVYSLVA